MKRMMQVFVFVLISVNLSAQMPQRFTYQAVIRDASGAIMEDQSLKIRIGIVQDSETGPLVWEEEHSTSSNGFGLVQLVIGDPGATVTGGSAATFSDIDWSTGTFYLHVQVDLLDGNGLLDMGTNRINTVPYAFYAENVVNKDDADADPANEIQDLQLTGNTLKITGNDAATDIDLSPYNDNPWVVSSDTLSHTQGSVAVGTDTPLGSKLTVQGDDVLSTKPLFEVKRQDGQPVFAVYNDSIRMYVNANTSAKGSKGGFAIGGFGASKGQIQDYLRITPDSVRIYIDESATKGERGGFAIGGFGVSKGSTTDLMRLNRDNYFIGHESGVYNTSGVYNSFIGYESGNLNTTGSSNVFLGYRSGKSNTEGYSNVFIGDNSGVGNMSGNSNVYIGDSVGSSNYGGDRNVVIGSLAAPYATSGDNNIIIGYKTAYASSHGSQNIFIGNYAGTNNTTGQNLFIGEYCGEQTTSGTRNSFVGFFAGQNNVTGQQNAYFGQFAGMDNTKSYNTFIGYWSGGNNVDGEMNAFLGYRSGQGNNGSNNVFLGYKAGEATSGDGNVFIGINSGSYQGTTINNQLFIDNTNTATPLIWGDFGTDHIRLNGNVGAGGYGAYSSYGLVVRGGTSNSLRVYTATGQTGQAVYVSGDMYVSGTITNPSDKRFKKNIREIRDPLDRVMHLTGVTFDWKSDAELSLYKKSFQAEDEHFSFNFPDGTQLGFVAQDVEKVVPEMVKTDENGFKSIDYTKLGPVLVEAIKAQQKQIEMLEKRIELLEKQRQ